MKAPHRRLLPVIMLASVVPLALLVAGNAAVPEAKVAAATPQEIPLDLRGRWGLTPADCDPLRTDFPAGLMEVSANVLTFSTGSGRMETVIAGSPEQIQASFAFAGEEASRMVALALESGGQRLQRSEYWGGTGGTAEYSRCP